MKAILHLGTEKTGTSSLQRFFHVNREKLVRQGFYFLESTGLENDRKLSAYSLLDHEYDDYHKKNLIKSKEDKQVFENDVEESLRREMAELPANIHTVIISSEHFHSRLRSEGNKLKLKSLLDFFFDSYHLVAYLRPQVELAVSYYSTTLKTAGTKTLEEHLSECHPGNYYYDYFSFIAGWENVFPRECFSVRLFGEKGYFSGDVINDFCVLFGVDITGFEKVSKINESVSPTGQEMLRSLNKKIPRFDDKLGLNPVNVKLKRLINKEFVGSGRRPSAEDGEKIQSRFDDVNEKIRARWFGEKEVLFEFDLSKYNKEEKADWGAVNVFDYMLENFSTGFSEMPSALNSSQVNQLRDIAVELERRGSFTEALALMKAAKSQRPNGPFINKKVLEYESVISDSVIVKNPHSGPSLYIDVEKGRVGKLAFYAPSPRRLIVEFDLDGEEVGCAISPEMLSSHSGGDAKLKGRSSLAVHYLSYLINSKINSGDFFWKRLSGSGFSFGDRLKVELEFEDGVGEDSNVLCYDSHVSFSSTHLIPDHKYYGNRGFSGLRKKILKLGVEKWEEKFSKGFWRGTTTGNVGFKLSVDNVDRLPRYTLSCISRDNESVLDAKISNVTKILGEKERADIKERLVAEQVFGEYVAFEDFSKYKYLVEIDGNVTPWSFLQKLMVGSCVLRVGSDRKQWYYDQLEEWVHYVPVKKDMSDLIEKIHWCKDNDDKAREIARNGQRFADSLSFDSQMNFAAEQLLSAARVVSE